MPAVVINTWSSKELIHGVAKVFILLVLPYIFQIFIVNNFFQNKKMYIM